MCLPNVLQFSCNVHALNVLLSLISLSYESSFLTQPSILHICSEVIDHIVKRAGWRRSLSYCYGYLELFGPWICNIAVCLLLSVRLFNYTNSLPVMCSLFSYPFLYNFFVTFPNVSTCQEAHGATFSAKYLVCFDYKVCQSLSFFGVELYCLSSTLIACHPPPSLCIHPHNVSPTLIMCHPPSSFMIHPHRLSSTLIMCYPPSSLVIYPHRLSSTLITCHPP